MISCKGTTNRCVVSKTNSILYKSRGTLSRMLPVFIPVLIVIFINAFFLKLVIVEGDSMFPTLHNNSLLIVRQILYVPKPQDIVLIKSDTRIINEDRIIKRIIAVEGQTVVVDYDNDIIMVDNVILEEPYINHEQIDPLQDKFGIHNGIVKYEVPQGHVFVMGDNRNFSMDSRDDRVGMFRNEDVLGAVVMYIPLGT